MAKSNEGKYFTFPITLLKGFTENFDKTRGCLMSILKYSFSYYYEVELEKHKLPHTDKEQAIEAFFNRYKFSAPKNFKECLLNHDTSIYSRPNFQFGTGNAPLTSIKVDTWIEYFMEEKTPHSNMCLLMYLAIKSFIGINGKSQYGTATYKQIFARMAGRTEFVSKDNLPEKIRNYFTERKQQNIMKSLENSWHLSRLPGNNFMYLSFTLSKEDLRKSIASKTKIEQQNN
jgi:hypothetical protein